MDKCSIRYEHNLDTALDTRNSALPLLELYSNSQSGCNLPIQISSRLAMSLAGKIQSGDESVEFRKSSCHPHLSQVCEALCSHRLYRNCTSWAHTPVRHLQHQGYKEVQGSSSQTSPVLNHARQSTRHVTLTIRKCNVSPGYQNINACVVVSLPLQSEPLLAGLQQLAPPGICQASLKGQLQVTHLHIMHVHP